MSDRISERFDPDAPILGHFELTNEVTGEFLNREVFLIKNISMGGFNLLSNYPPLIGNDYPIVVEYEGQRHAFAIRIIHSHVFSFLGRPEGIFREGLVYACGCQIHFENAAQKSLVLCIIQNDCGIPVVAGMASTGDTTMAIAL
jgi:hypothetical protein